jgi:hypothetical protein
MKGYIRRLILPKQKTTTKDGKREYMKTYMQIRRGKLKTVISQAEVAKERKEHPWASKKTAAQIARDHARGRPQFSATMVAHVPTKSPVPRMAKQDFDTMYRALFKGVKNPEVSYRNPDAWRG